MATFNAENFEIIEDNVKFLAERLDSIESQLSPGSESKAVRASQQAARERRLLREEINSSKGVAANQASMLNEVYDQLKEAQATFKTLADSTGSELMKKERSAQASTQLLQTRQADVEEQLANVTQQLQELTGLVGQVDSNRKRNEQMLDQVEGRLKQLLDDSSFRKDLREIASKEAGNANRDQMLEVGMLAIRQAIDLGLLQPGPGFNQEEAAA